MRNLLLHRERISEMPFRRLTPIAQLAYFASYQWAADDWGRMPDDYAFLVSRLFVDIVPERVYHDIVEQVVACPPGDYWVRYSVNGAPYLWLPRLALNTRFVHRAGALYPPPPDELIRSVSPPPYETGQPATRRTPEPESARAASSFSAAPPRAATQPERKPASVPSPPPAGASDLVDYYDAVVGVYHAYSRPQAIATVQACLDAGMSMDELIDRTDTYAKKKNDAHVPPFQRCTPQSFFATAVKWKREDQAKAKGQDDLVTSSASVTTPDDWGGSNIRG